MDVRLTVDEIVGTLSHSNLPTILVEGVDDARRYRWIEDAVLEEVSVLQAGGRDTLLQVYEKCHTYSAPVAFVADRDLWYFDGVPETYKDIVFTTGFSIENDILSSRIVQGLFTKTEMTEYNDLKKELTKWYAFEIERYKAGDAYKLDYSVYQLIDTTTGRFKSDAVLPRSFQSPSAEVCRQIELEFDNAYRGKNLLGLYAYIFAKRDPSKGEGNHYSDKQIIEMSAKVGSSPVLKSLAERIRKALFKDVLPQNRDRRGWCNERVIA